MVGAAPRAASRPTQPIKAGLDSAFADDVDVPDAFVDDLDGMTYSSYDKSDASRTTSWRTAELGSDQGSGVPLLVIFGTEDEIVDPEAADAWAEGRPGGRAS